MSKISSILVQCLAYFFFFGVIYYLSTSPAYHYLQPGEAEIKLAFKHASQRQKACHQRTREEMMRLPPNMRRVQDCPRARAPIYIELLLDGAFLAHRSFVSPGLSHDMATFVYTKYSLPAGKHLLTVRMRDSMREEGFDFLGEREVDLIPGQALVIGFAEEQGGFIFNN
ncbi:MAG: hypothetical protein H7832_10100 [Magnetococcus sp. DMHC-6]